MHVFTFRGKSIGGRTLFLTLIFAMSAFAGSPAVGQPAGQDWVFPCADANGDQKILLDDAVYTLNYLYKGGPAPNCAAEGSLYPCSDANGDQKVLLSDAVYTLNYLYLGGPAPQCSQVCGSNICGQVTATGHGVRAYVWALPDGGNGLTGNPVGPFSTDASGDYTIDVGSGQGELPAGSYVLVATSVKKTPDTLSRGESTGVFDFDRDGSSACPTLVQDDDDSVDVDAQSSMTADIEMCELCVEVDGTVPAGLNFLLGLGSAGVFNPASMSVDTVWDFLWRPFTGTNMNQFTLWLPEGPKYLIVAAGLSLAQGRVVLGGFYDANHDGSNRCPHPRATIGDLVQPDCDNLQSAKINNLCPD